MNILQKFYYYCWRLYDKYEGYIIYKFFNPYHIEMPSGNCPVQSEGTLKTGEWYYFRARGSGWSFTISINEDEWFKCKHLFYYVEKDYCEWPDAGWLSKGKCIKLSTKALKMYYKQNEKHN